MSISKTGILNSNNFVEYDVINPNIIVNSYTMPLGSANASTGTWRTAGTSNMSRSRVLIQDGMYGFQNSGIQTANDGSCYGIDSYPFEANTDYVISFLARITSGTDGYAGYNIYNATYIKGSHVKVDKQYIVTPLNTNWKVCWLNFRTNSTLNRNIYIGVTTGSTSVTTQICKVKIEKGDYPTPWIPNIEDSEYEEYPAMKIFNNQIQSKEFIEI